MLNPNKKGVWPVPMLLQDRLSDFHRNLIFDSVRTGSFRQAIHASVKPGDVVCDVGAGTGILSIFAAQAGARRVYAIEGGPIAAAARMVAKANGLDDIVSVINENSLGVSLPESVDVVVSECIGWMMYVGDMFSAVADARDRMLKPGGLVIPNRVRLFAAPIESFHHYSYVYCFQDGAIDGIDLGALRNIDNVFVTTIPRDSFLAKPEQVAEAELASGYPSETIDTLVEFSIERDAMLHGFCLWFDVDLCEGVGFSTAPWETSTIWQQTFIGCGSQIAVSKGSTVTLRIKLWRSLGNFMQKLEWHIGVCKSEESTQQIDRYFSTVKVPIANQSDWTCSADGHEWLELRRSRYKEAARGTKAHWLERIFNFGSRLR